MSRKNNVPDNIVQFERGCRRCGNLMRVGRNTYICSVRVNMDDSAVIPIQDGEHTADWNVCEGEDYVFNPTTKEKHRSKSS